MATEKRLIDADSLEAEFRETKMSAVFPKWRNMDIIAKCSVIEYAKKVKSIVTNAPTVDAVEVVRCKDCIFFKKGQPFKHKCKNMVGGMYYVSPDDFCSYGERRPDEK